MIPKSQYKEQKKLFFNRENYLLKCEENQEVDKYRLSSYKSKQRELGEQELRKMFARVYKFKTLCSYDFEVKLLLIS